jgi:cation transport regulator ChaC
MTVPVESPGGLWYFGYGSNMHPSIFLARRRMQPQAAVCGRLENHRLCFNLPVGPGERGVANVEPAPGVHTWGVLYLLTPEECVRLDRSEGVPVGVYRRVTVEVLAVGERRVQAFTYRAGATREGRKPSARYLGLLVDGARHHGLPAEYVGDLERLELAWDERVGPRPPS